MASDTAPEPVGLVLHNPRRYDLRLWLMTRGREGAFRRSIVELARIEPGDAVLDVGCGTGSLAIEAAKVVGPQGRVVGVDPSPEMIGRAKAKARRLRSIEFHTAAAQDLPFPDASFDVALSTFVLHQMAPHSFHRAKTETVRVLKPGGRLLIVDIGGEQGGRQTVHVRAAARHGVHLFDLRDIVPLLPTFGLAEVASGDLPFRLSFFERAQYVLAEKPNG